MQLKTPHRKKGKYFLLILLLFTAGMTKAIAQSRLLLLEESFDGDSMPAGWSINEHPNNWSVSASNNAGGETNELRLTWSPQFNGVSRFVSPAVDLTGVTSVMFSFKHALDNYSGTNTIGVATSSDGGTNWNEAWSQNYYMSNVYSVATEISTPDMGQANVQFCIFFDGNTYNINDWFFDDIVVFSLEDLDLGLQSATLPDFVNSGETSFGMTVFNYGATVVTSVQATYEVEGLEPVTETFTVNIPALSAQTLNFNTTSLMVPGSYNIVYSIDLVNGQTDDVAENNMLEKHVSVAIGTVERIPIIEHFLSSTCINCLNVDQQMLNFCNNNLGRFTYTKYQMNWPGSGDPYYTEEGGVRRYYYGVNAVPQCFLDGEDQGYSSIQQSIFNEHALRTAFMDIRGSFTVEGNIINIKADIMPYIDVDARIFLSVNEKETYNNVGGNGETSFQHVFMKMLPDAQGTFVSFNACELQHLEFTQDMSETHVEEMSDLEVSIWVQNYNTKEIFNSHFAYEYTDVHPYPVQNLNLVEDDDGIMVASWSAPSQATGYRVYVNGEMVMDNTTSLNYSFSGGTTECNVIGVQALYGDNMTSVIAFDSQSTNTQTSTFSEGYNWWSTYIEQEGIDGLGMLEEGLGDNGVTIRSQVGYTDYYQGYGWYGSLSSINNESSYKVITNVPCTVTMTGDAAVPSQHPITLGPGWTWIGYVPSTAMSVDAAMAGVDAVAGDKVKSQQGYADYYGEYGWYGSLNTIEPGMGLMYYSTNSNPVTFTYPDSNRGGEQKKNLTAENNHWVPNVYAYPDNMTVMAIVELDDKELTSDNYELAAFANGECRGSVKLTYAEPLNRHVAFLTVSGKDVAELTFRLYNTETNEEYYDAEESLNFVANAIVGEANDLYVVHFRGATDLDEFTSRVKVYPNPVNCGEQFSIDLAGDMTDIVCVEIVNTLGVVETVYATSRQTFTAPNVASIYTLRITMEGDRTCICKLVVK